MSREDTMRKVRALFAKENAPGTTPEEVAAAIAKATRLLEREGLTRAALEIEGTNSEPVEETRIFEVPLDGDMHKSKITWRVRLACVLTNSFGCYTFTRGGAIMIVGKPSDSETVRYLFAYCAREIERIAKPACAGNGKTYANNFKIGCVDAIQTAISREKDAERQAARSAANTSGALVLVNNAIVALDKRAKDSMALAYAKLNMKNSAPVSARSDYGAREHGRSAGANIYPGTNSAKISGFNKQIGGK